MNKAESKHFLNSDLTFISYYLLVILGVDLTSQGNFPREKVPVPRCSIKVNSTGAIFCTATASMKLLKESCTITNFRICFNSLSLLVKYYFLWSKYHLLEIVLN